MDPQAVIRVASTFLESRERAHLKPRLPSTSASPYESSLNPLVHSSPAARRRQRGERYNASHLTNKGGRLGLDRIGNKDLRQIIRMQKDLQATRKIGTGEPMDDDAMQEEEKRKEQTLSEAIKIFMEVDKAKKVYPSPQDSWKRLKAVRLSKRDRDLEMRDRQVKERQARLQDQKNERKRREEQRAARDREMEFGTKLQRDAVRQHKQRLAAGLTRKLRRLATEDVFDAKQVRSRQAREMFSDEQDQLKDILPNDSASYHEQTQKSEREKRDRDRSMGFNAALNKAHPNFQNYIAKHFPHWEGSVLVEIGCCHISPPVPSMERSLEAALVDMQPPAKNAFKGEKDAEEAEERKKHTPLFIDKNDEAGGKGRQGGGSISMPDVPEGSERGSEEPLFPSKRTSGSSLLSKGGTDSRPSLVLCADGQQAQTVVQARNSVMGRNRRLGIRMSAADMQRRSVVARNGVPVTSVLVFEKLHRNHTKNFLMSHQTDFQTLNHPTFKQTSHFRYNAADKHDMVRFALHQVQIPGQQPVCFMGGVDTSARYLAQLILQQSFNFAESHLQADDTPRGGGTRKRRTHKGKKKKGKEVGGAGAGETFLTGVGGEQGDKHEGRQVLPSPVVARPKKSATFVFQLSHPNEKVAHYLQREHCRMYLRCTLEHDNLWDLLNDKLSRHM